MRSGNHAHLAGASHQCPSRLHVASFAMSTWQMHAPVCDAQTCAVSTWPTLLQSNKALPLLAMRCTGACAISHMLSGMRLATYLF